MIPNEETSGRKKEIEGKLKQEEEMLTFIKESLDKSDQLTNNMVSILSSFESRLMKLENSIIPVHKQTETLQRLQENVERTLSCLDHVISYYHVATETERVIREGPSGRLEEYLSCIAKIQKAVEYFQDNNPDSPELNTVKSLFERGKESLDAEFRNLLQRHSKPVPPILILDLIGTDEEIEGQEEGILEHLPEGILQDIIRISQWLIEYGRNQDFMNVYYQIRSSQLDRSIKGLKEHFRKNSATPGVPYSPIVPNKKKDTPTKKPAKRPVFIPGHEQDSRSRHHGETMGEKHGTPLGKEDVLDFEIDTYMYCISAFVRLAQSEYQLLMDIIPEHHQKKTFDSLIQETLDNLMLEGENIVLAAKKANSRHDFTSVLSIFPILRHLKLLKPEFDKVLQGTAASTKNKLPNLINSIETTGAKALEDFADSIKNDPDKENSMSKDGTVHELTSNAILFLQQLLEFQETAGAMLASQESSSTASSYSTEFSRRLLSTYICKVLGNLQLKLLSKSKMYEDLALGAIFLHNNYNYILKSLEKSELMQLVSVTQKNPDSLYQEHIEQQIQTYQRSWLKVIDYVSDKNMPALQGAKLKDKERQIIKERFKGFNEGLEEICKIQKSWAIPDKRQRERIRQAQKTIVQEVYGAFLHKYGTGVSFTKNPDKYIKYSVEHVGDMIERLFDTSA
ncbi:exocyst complex component 7-like isoform X7 [Rana temporaria]|uniref:exocyst complex component 7-like isoform X7 n=1 Tax=Rana temporaria TaxID=8407 RepID=UPI001AAD6E12|nr:exocyst complex component 7-like isoform X7 [Rana temporaria]